METMPLSMVVTCDTIITTSHCHYHVTRHHLDTWQIFNLKKNRKKLKKLKNLKKKKGQDCIKFFQIGTKLKRIKKGIKLIFLNKIGDQRH